ncbi:MAG: phosphotransferase [Candidatus Latescibacteria bacterium]|nr:phosphotransferase [Candidatus Latescibacterota bacterium]
MKPTELLGRGRTAAVYRNEAGQAVKIFHAGVADGLVQHEARIAAALAGVCPVAPDFYGIKDCDGRPALLYQLIEGTALIEWFRREEVDIAGLASRLAAVHRSVHAAAATRLPTMAQAWAPKLRQYGQLSTAGIERLLDFIDRDPVRKICHGDLHPENAMEDSNGQLWAIDWTNAYSGHPLSDMARTVYLLRYGLPPEQARIGAAEKALREQGVEVFLESYGGSDPRQDPDWPVWWLLVLIGRCSERIGAEQSDIDRMIAQSLAARPEFA